MVHVRKVDFDFFTNGEEVCILIVIIKIIRIRNLGQIQNTVPRLIVFNRLDCVINQLLHAVNRQAE